MSACPHDWYPIGGQRESCDLCGAFRRKPPLVENSLRLWCPRNCGRAFVRKKALQKHLAAPCAPLRYAGRTHRLGPRK